MWRTCGGEELPRPCIMTLLNCSVWPVPVQGGNAETVLRPEKVLSKCFRTGVRLPSAPPHMKNPNLFPIGNAFGFFIFIKDISY